MGAIIYNKLVRDKIPEIIEASGKTCETEILSDKEYLQMLDKKLGEELAEYYKEQNIEELADLLEVLYATAKALTPMSVHVAGRLKEVAKLTTLLNAPSPILVSTEELISPDTIEQEAKAKSPMFVTEVAEIEDRSKLSHTSNILGASI